VSTDLEETLVAARSALDSLPLPAPDAIRRRGDRRRRRRRVFTGAGVIAAVLAITGSVALLSHSVVPQPLPGTPIAPPGFAKLAEIREPFPYATGRLIGPSSTAMLSGVGFAAWSDGGGAHIAAADLSSGRALWSSAPGGIGDWESLTPIGPVVLARWRPGTGATRVYVVDAATGVIRWHTTSRVMVVNSAIVAIGQNRLEGLDMTSGRTLWQVEVASGLSVVGMNGRQDSLRTPSLEGGAGVPVYSDSRLLVLDQGGHRLRFLDSRTRTWSATTQFGTAQSLVYGYEGIAYTVGRTEGGVASKPFDLNATDDTGATKVAYQVPKGFSLDTDFRPCGEAACFLVLGAQKSILGALRSGRSLWDRQIAPEAALLSAEAGRLLVRAGSDILLADAAGVIASFPVQGRRVGAIGTREVLLFPSFIGYTAPVPTQIAGLTFWDDRETALGTITVVANACSWNDLYLLCPGATGIQVWRLAN
jgi:hypothetical protein